MHSWHAMQFLRYTLDIPINVILFVTPHLSDYSCKSIYHSVSFAWGGGGQDSVKLQIYTKVAIFTLGALSDSQNINVT